MAGVLDPSRFKVVGEAEAPTPAGARVLDPERFRVVEGASKLESFGRGALQGVTMGFGDEAQGIADYLISGKPYKVGRDEARASNEIARSSNPLTYAAGDVAGGVATAFVPGLGVAKGVGAGARIGKAAAMGAVSGAGYSDSDDLQTLATDIVKGGALGAAGGAAFEGVGRLIGRAPKRADDRLIQGITEGAKPSLGEKLVGKGGERRADVLKAIRGEGGEHVLAEMGVDPAKASVLVKAARAGDGEGLLDAVKTAAKPWREARDIFYNKVDGTGARIDPTDALGSVMNVRAQLAKSPATIGQADALGRVEDEIARAWNNKAGITARELREEVTRLQTEARSYYRASLTGGVAPEAAEAKKHAADALRDMLHEHVEAVAQKNGLPGADKLREINKRMSIFSDLEDAAATKATREAKVPPHRLGWMMDVAMGLTEPITFVAKKVLIDSGLGREAAAIADDKLAAWVQAAQKGAGPAQLKAMAAQLGIGAAAADALNLWASEKLQPLMGGGGE